MNSTLKTDIIWELKENSKTQAEIAREFDVTESYVSQLKKELEYKTCKHTLQRLLRLIELGAVKFYEDKLTQSDKEFLEAL